MNTILEAGQTFFSTFGAMSFQDVAALYGKMCFVTLPFSLIVLIYIYKKRPSLVSKFDAAIDRLLDGKAAVQSEASQAPAEDMEAVEEVATMKDIPLEEENEQFGIANMKLVVGDKYKCFLSQKNRQEIRGGDYSWSTDNPFVGTIHEGKGVFVARKVGKTFVECGGEHIRIYYADISPRNKEWFACQPLADLYGHASMATIKIRELKRKIRDLDESRGLIVYEWQPGTLTYQLDKKDRVVRLLFRLPKDTDLEGIKSGLAEYMEIIKAEAGNPQCLYWYHKNGLDDEYPQSVDLAAFLMPSAKGDWYFGIGEYWRAGADEKELANNPEMMIRTFSDMLDKADIPQVVGSELQEDYTKEEQRQMKREETRLRRKTSARSRKSVPIVAESQTASEEAPQEEEEHIPVPGELNGGEKDYPDYSEDDSYDEGSDVVTLDEENPDPLNY